MNFDRPIVLGARASVLAQVQARLVGDALLARNPGLKVEYSFLSSPGDRELDTPLPELLRRGGFTGDLGVALRANAIDIAVHLWKDLPFATNPLTHIAATLPRADTRDLLLVKRELAGGTRSQRAARLVDRPRAGAPISRDFCSGRCPRNPRALSSCWRAAIAKRDSRNSWTATSPRWSSPRPTSIGCSNPRADEFAAVRDARACGARCLRNHGAAARAESHRAGPGRAGARDPPRSRRPRRVVSAINDEATFGRVIAERARLAPTGDEDHPLGVSIVPIHCGEVEFTRGQKAGQWIQSAELRRHDSPLPPAASPNAVWTGDEGSADRYRRVALQVRHDQFADARIGLFVARSEAWPEGFSPRPGQVVWSAGIDTWRRLAARGIWVHGSDESLGEGGGAALRSLFPRVAALGQVLPRPGLRFALQRAHSPPTASNAAPRWPI